MGVDVDTIGSVRIGSSGVLVLEVMGSNITHILGDAPPLLGYRTLLGKNDLPKRSMPLKIHLHNCTFAYCSTSHIHSMQKADLCLSAPDEQLYNIEATICKKIHLTVLMVPTHHVPICQHLL